MTKIHANYDQLTETERKFVDEMFSKPTFARAKSYSIVLTGDDDAERAVDAVAAWVIASR